MKRNKSINHTFVVCAYKESKYLERCIRSVLNQSVKSRVLMATSTDNAYIRSMAEKYGLELSVASHESDISRDWNFAIAQADTDYVTIAHQDDIYDRTYAESVCRALDSRSDSLICCTGYYEIRRGDKVITNTNLVIKRILLMPLLLRACSGLKFIKRAPIALGNGICCPSVTFVKSKVPTPLFAVGMKSNIDWEAWERLSKMRGSFGYVPRPLMGHRIHEESTTTEIIGDSSRGEEDYYMFKKFWPDFLARRLARAYKNSERSNAL